MSTRHLFIFATILFLTSCGHKKTPSDASGIFEATEVVVSAQANGELMMFNLSEGMDLQENQKVGYIDTTQLHLKKQQLLASMQSVDSRYINVARQIASTQQQIATQQSELKRFENLVRANAANQKQVDDIGAQISVLERQLAAQKEILENNNRSLSGETQSLLIQVAQIDDQIRRSIITSPIAGTVLSKYAERGELMITGKMLFRIADISQMKLKVYISADQLTTMKIGQQVRVFSDSGKTDHREYRGTVVWISDKAEFTPKTIQTRNERANLVYAVRIAVENDGYIKRGMYGEISL